MKKRRIILLICVGLVLATLFSCESNEAKNQAKINELENELESYKEENIEYKKEVKENEVYKKKLDNLMKDVEKMKKEEAKKKVDDEKKGKEEKNIKYNKYTNSRFGFSIEYPDYLKKESDSENGDGAVFTGRGATLVAVGRHNSNNQTLDEVYNDEIRYTNENLVSGKITYKSKGKSSFVISWSEDGNIYYKYIKVGSGGVAGFVIEYPENEGKLYDSVVTHIYNTFNAGNLNY